MSNIRVAPNRANQVRERQNQRIQSRVQKTSENLSMDKKRTSTPVFTRGLVSGLTYPITTPQKVKRQFHYSVGNTGAEIRFPSIPQIQIGWRLLSSLLFIACIVMVYFLLNAPIFVVDQLETEGLDRLTASDLNSVLDINGKSIVWMNASKAKADLIAAFPELKEISVNLVLPNHIQISLVERKPVLAWKIEEETYWIDNEGIMIPSRGDPGELLVVNAGAMPPFVKTADLIEPMKENSIINSVEEKSFSIAQIQGYGDQVDPAMVDAAFKLSLQIPTGSKILYNENHGLGWKSEGGWDVFVGSTLDNIDYRLNAYNALINKLSEEGIAPTWVSIEHLNAPYFRE